MTWGNPPKLDPAKSKTGKVITPAQLAGDSEHSHQVALFAWAALNFARYPQLKYMFAIPNGGLRDIRTATNLKAEGVKAGVPDIFLPVPYIYRYAGLFIELKVGKNKPTKEQIEWIDNLTKSGYYCKVCYSWIEAKDCLVNYLEGKC